MFLNFAVAHGKSVHSLLPEDLLSIGFAFFERVRATDALPVADSSFGDALLFQWGTREALPGYCDECYYFDLTRQFISRFGESDDAMFQLHCELQYDLTPDLRSVQTAHRWCSSLEALPEFKQFAYSHPALSAVARKPPRDVKFHFGGV